MMMATGSILPASSSKPTPPLPPRRTSLSTAPAAQTAKLQVTVTTLPANPKIANTMRHGNPARSSTGTFQDSSYYNTYYARPSSPRSSGERVGSHHQSSYYTPSSPMGPRVTTTTSNSFTRPRRNTGETMARPATTSMPIRTPYTPHGHLDRPSSPLAQSWDRRGDTYISHGPSRSTHKKIYSVDDATHSAQLVAATDVETHRHRDSFDRGYTTSGSRTYHNANKPPPRLSDLGDDGYSYTDPASMYRDTEPAWRRPRAGSLERSSRPSSMIIDRPPRSSARELGPPPSTRGFDKINSGIPRSHGRSSSIDRSRDIPKYDPYPDAAPARSSSTRNHAPAIHQEPRRDTYHDSYDRRDREIENRRHNSVDRYEDPHVSSRGFGIATGPPPAAHDHHALDRQPLYTSQDATPGRSDDYGSHYHSSHRADARMPEPRAADPRSSDSRIADKRSSRDAAPAYDVYDKQPRDSSKAYVPALAAGAVTGAAATLGAAGYMKSRDRDQDRNSSEERERERERERRREYDERDRRDKYDDRRDERRETRSDDRDRRLDERRDVPPPSTTPVNPPYPAPGDVDKKSREKRYEDEERNKSSRKAPSSEGSGDERPRHYVDRDAERRKDAAPAPATLDPDEEYRRRVQQEAERSRRSDRDREYSDSDRERERRRRKDERSRSRGPEPAQDSSRRDERSSSIYDSNLVQEPESMDKLNADQPNKQVTIVTPPKEATPAVRGILRKPTEKFPEDPEPIREGVAPHKDALKGKDIPVGARWTRIDRRLVNPEALEEAKERFEERMDCVIVLRVLTKQEIQKLADRTKRIRERREDEYERREQGERSSRDDRDDEDRDRDRERGRDRDRERRRRYDDEESDYEDLARHHERERERDRDKPKMLEPAR